MSGPIPNADAVRTALTRLRTRTGLNAARLRSTEVGVRALFDLPIVKQATSADGLEPEAADTVIRRIAGQLPLTELAIVDAALSLGLLAERLPGRQEIASLYAADVGERRERLVELWGRIHEWLGVPPPDTSMTVRGLRTTQEADAIEKLAELCVRESWPDPVPAEPGRSRDGNAGATLTVIGSAVMDQIYVTDHLPESGASAELETYETHPGGKGLVHAVASARMGMNVQLMTAIGDDAPGRELTGYMDREGLSTELVKITPNAMSPVVAVLKTPSGRGRYLSWANQELVRLVPTDFHTRRLRSALEASDAVVLTFEQPLDTTRAALRAVRESENEPLVVVRPSPPVKDPRALYDHFKDIDFLIGDRWELRKLMPGAQGELSTEELAKGLRELGARGVCVTEEFGCVVRSENTDLDIARFPARLRDTPGAREAFSAALIHRILAKKRNFDHTDLEWATAAMSASQSSGGVADSMPDVHKVERAVEARVERDRISPKS
ncbi:PfkB family carbohydrate kinase [Amycolatopsis azurea]|uniref:Carbohydrate kinase PfkB domain-containing protein n=1 Tax=Amycolatopsis azurea DSM 43854 TaxID=1238180 RepID=M2PSS9_9PSEU|nr:PfkB family carbohydrate kinase [Amycolatopsis azurea]EMD27643.1 hypothetical protein C791_1939 [Amycolatopsis azurea DSM 43854]OOC03045.1 hypothetical protein B0293_29200 [Amycolatopsis azurea DSM 43854]